MTIAEQIKFFHRERAIRRLPDRYPRKVDWAADIVTLCEHAERIGTVTQDWDNESTEYDFADGSVLIVCGSDVFVYGSR